MIPFFFFFSSETREENWLLGVGFRCLLPSEWLLGCQYVDCLNLLVFVDCTGNPAVVRLREPRGLVLTVRTLSRPSQDKEEVGKDSQAIRRAQSRTLHTVLAKCWSSATRAQSWSDLIKQNIMC